MENSSIDISRRLAEKDAYIYAAMVGQGMTNSVKVSPWRSDKMRDMVFSRLRWNNLPGSFKHLDAHALNDDTAVVFIIAGGKPMHIEDDLNLFPSDALISQLRLLVESTS